MHHAMHCKAIITITITGDGHNREVFPRMLATDSGRST